MIDYKIEEGFMVKVDKTLVTADEIFYELTNQLANSFMVQASIEGSTRFIAIKKRPSRLRYAVNNKDDPLANWKTIVVQNSKDFILIDCSSVGQEGVDSVEEFLTR